MKIHGRKHGLFTSYSIYQRSISSLLSFVFFVTTLLATFPARADQPISPTNNEDKKAQAEMYMAIVKAKIEKTCKNFFPMAEDQDLAWAQTEPRFFWKRWSNRLDKVDAYLKEVETNMKVDGWSMDEQAETKFNCARLIWFDLQDDLAKEAAKSPSCFPNLEGNVLKFAQDYRVCEPVYLSIETVLERVVNKSYQRYSKLEDDFVFWNYKNQGKVVDEQVLNELRANEVVTGSMFQTLNGLLQQIRQYRMMYFSPGNLAKIFSDVKENTNDYDDASMYLSNSFAMMQQVREVAQTKITPFSMFDGQKVEPKTQAPWYSVGSFFQAAPEKDPDVLDIQFAKALPASMEAAWEDPNIDRLDDSLLKGLTLSSIKQSAFQMWGDILWNYGSGYFQAWQRKVSYDKLTPEQQATGKTYYYGEYRSEYDVAFQAFCSYSGEFGKLCKETKITLDHGITMPLRQYVVQIFDEFAAQQDLYGNKTEDERINKRSNPAVHYASHMKVFNGHIQDQQAQCHAIYKTIQKDKEAWDSSMHVVDYGTYAEVPDYDMSRTGIERTLGNDEIAKFKTRYQDIINGKIGNTLQDEELAEAIHYEGYEDDLTNCARKNEAWNTISAGQAIAAQDRIRAIQLKVLAKSIQRNVILMKPGHRKVDVHEAIAEMIQYQPMAVLDFLITHPSQDYAIAIGKHIHQFAVDKKWDVIGRRVFFAFSLIVLAAAVVLSFGTAAPEAAAIVGYLSTYMLMYSLLVSMPQGIARQRKENELTKESLSIGSYWSFSSMLEKQKQGKDALHSMQVWYWVQVGLAPLAFIGPVRNAIQQANAERLLLTARTYLSEGASIQAWEKLYAQMQKNPRIVFEQPSTGAVGGKTPYANMPVQGIKIENLSQKIKDAQRIKDILRGSSDDIEGIDPWGPSRGTPNKPNNGPSGSGAGTGVLAKPTTSSLISNTSGKLNAPIANPTILNQSIISPGSSFVNSVINIAPNFFKPWENVQEEAELTPKDVPYIGEKIEVDTSYLYPKKTDRAQRFEDLLNSGMYNPEFLAELCRTYYAGGGFRSRAAGKILESAGMLGRCEEVFGNIPFGYATGYNLPTGEPVDPEDRAQALVNAIEKIKKAKKIIKNGGAYTPSLKYEFFYWLDQDENPEMQALARNAIEKANVDRIENASSWEFLLNRIDQSDDVRYFKSILNNQDQETLVHVIKVFQGKATAEPKDIQLIQRMTSLSNTLGFISRLWYSVHLKLPILQAFTGISPIDEMNKLSILQMSKFDDVLGVNALNWYIFEKKTVREANRRSEYDTDTSRMYPHLYQSSMMTKREVFNFYADLAFTNKLKSWVNITQELAFKNEYDFREFERFCTYFHQIPIGNNAKDEIMHIFRAYLRTQLDVNLVVAEKMAEDLYNSLAAFPRTVAGNVDNVLNQLLYEGRQINSGTALHYFTFQSGERSVIMERFRTLFFPNGLYRRAGQIESDPNINLLKTAFDNRFNDLTAYLASKDAPFNQLGIHQLLKNFQDYRNEITDPVANQFEIELYQLMYRIHMVNEQFPDNELGIQSRLTALITYLQKYFPQLPSIKIRAIVRDMAQAYILGRNPKGNNDDAGSLNKNEQAILKTVKDAKLSITDIRALPVHKREWSASTHKWTSPQGEIYYFVTNDQKPGNPLESSSVDFEFASYQIDQKIFKRYPAAVLMEMGGEKVFVFKRVEPELKFNFTFGELQKDLTLVTKTESNLSLFRLKEEALKAIRSRFVIGSPEEFAVGSPQYNMIVRNDIAMSEIPSYILLEDLLFGYANRNLYQGLFMTNCGPGKSLIDLTLGDLPYRINNTNCNIGIYNGQKNFQFKLEDYLQATKVMSVFLSGYNYDHHEEHDPISIVKKAIKEHKPLIQALEDWTEPQIRKQFASLLTESQLEVLLANRRTLITMMHQQEGGSGLLPTATIASSKETKPDLAKEIDQVLTEQGPYILNDRIAYTLNERLKDETLKGSIELWIQRHLDPNDVVYKQLYEFFTQNPANQTTSQKIVAQWFAVYGNNGLRADGKRSLDSKNEKRKQIKEWILKQIGVYQGDPSRDLNVSNANSKVTIKITKDTLEITEESSDPQIPFKFRLHFDQFTNGNWKVSPSYLLLYKNAEKIYQSKYLTMPDMSDLMFSFIENVKGGMIQTITSVWIPTKDPITSQMHAAYKANRAKGLDQKTSAAQTPSGNLYTSRGFAVKSVNSPDIEEKGVIRVEFSRETRISDPEVVLASSINSPVVVSSAPQGIADSKSTTIREIIRQIIKGNTDFIANDELIYEMHQMMKEGTSDSSDIELWIKKHNGKNDPYYKELKNYVMIPFLGDVKNALLHNVTQGQYLAISWLAKYGKDDASVLANQWIIERNNVKTEFEKSLQNILSEYRANSRKPMDKTIEMHRTKLQFTIDDHKVKIQEFSDNSNIPSFAFGFSFADEGNKAASLYVSCNFLIRKYGQNIYHSKFLSGSDLVKFMLLFVEEEKGLYPISIDEEWFPKDGPDGSQNYLDFIRSYRNGDTPVQAAAKTWAGRVYAPYDFISEEPRIIGDNNLLIESRFVRSKSDIASAVNSNQINDTPTPNQSVKTEYQKKQDTIKIEEQKIADVLLKDKLTYSQIKKLKNSNDYDTSPKIWKSSSGQKYYIKEDKAEMEYFVYKIYQKLSPGRYPASILTEINGHKLFIIKSIPLTTFDFIDINGVLHKNQTISEIRSIIDDDDRASWGDVTHSFDYKLPSSIFLIDLLIGMTSDRGLEHNVLLRNVKKPKNKTVQYGVRYPITVKDEDIFVIDGDNAFRFENLNEILTSKTGLTHALIMYSFGHKLEGNQKFIQSLIQDNLSIFQILSSWSEQEIRNELTQYIPNYIDKLIANRTLLLNLAAASIADVTSTASISTSQTNPNVTNTSTVAIFSKPLTVNEKAKFILEGKNEFKIDDKLIYELNQLAKEGLEYTQKFEKWIQNHMDPHDAVYIQFKNFIQDSMEHPEQSVSDSVGKYILIQWIAKYGRSNNADTKAAQDWLDHRSASQETVKKWLLQVGQEYLAATDKDNFQRSISIGDRDVYVIFNDKALIITESNPAKSSHPFRFTFGYNILSKKFVNGSTSAYLLEEIDNKLYHSAYLQGTSLFEFMFDFMESMRGLSIISIEDHWMHDEATYLSQMFYEFERSIKAGMSLKDAATSTWSGQLYLKHFLAPTKNSVTVKKKGSNIESIRAIFFKDPDLVAAISSNNASNALNPVVIHTATPTNDSLIKLSDEKVIKWNQNVKNVGQSLNTKELALFNLLKNNKMTLQAISNLPNVDDVAPGDSGTVKVWKRPDNKTIYFKYGPYIHRVFDQDIQYEVSMNEYGVYLINKQVINRYPTALLIESQGQKIFVIEGADDFEFDYRDKSETLHKGVSNNYFFTEYFNKLVTEGNLMELSNPTVRFRSVLDYVIPEDIFLFDLLISCFDRKVYKNIVISNYPRTDHVYTDSEFPIKIDPNHKDFKIFDGEKTLGDYNEDFFDFPRDFIKLLNNYSYKLIETSSSEDVVKLVASIFINNKKFFEKLNSWSDEEITKQLSPYLDDKKIDILIKNRMKMLKFVEEIQALIKQNPGLLNPPTSSSLILPIIISAPRSNSTTSNVATSPKNALITNTNSLDNMNATMDANKTPVDIAVPSSTYVVVHPDIAYQSIGVENTGNSTSAISIEPKKSIDLKSLKKETDKLKQSFLKELTSLQNMLYAARGMKNDLFLYKQVFKSWNKGKVTVADYFEFKSKLKKAATPAQKIAAYEFFYNKLENVEDYKKLAIAFWTSNEALRDVYYSILKSKQTYSKFLQENKKFVQRLKELMDSKGYTSEIKSYEWHYVLVATPTKDAKIYPTLLKYFQDDALNYLNHFRIMIDPVFDSRAAAMFPLTLVTNVVPNLNALLSGKLNTDLLHEIRHFFTNIKNLMGVNSVFFQTFRNEIQPLIDDRNYNFFGSSDEFYAQGDTARRLSGSTLQKYMDYAKRILRETKYLVDHKQSNQIIVGEGENGMFNVSIYYSYQGIRRVYSTKIYEDFNDAEKIKQMVYANLTKLNHLAYLAIMIISKFDFRYLINKETFLLETANSLYNLMKNADAMPDAVPAKKDAFQWKYVVQLPIEVPGARNGVTITNIKANSSVSNNALSGNGHTSTFLFNPMILLNSLPSQVLSQGPIAEDVEQNELKILESDQDAISSLFKMLDSAKRKAYFTFFDLEKGIVSDSKLFLIRELARKGVDTRIIIDDLFNAVNSGMIAHLQAEGVKIKIYHKFNIRNVRSWFSNSVILNRLHTKIVVVDEMQADIGGRNSSNHYYGLRTIGRSGSWIDRDMYVQGQIVQDINAFFLSTWNGADVASPTVGDVSADEMVEAKKMLDRYAAAIKRWRIQYAQDNPISNSTYQVSIVQFVIDPLEKIDMIDKAKTRILIQAPYLYLSTKMMQALQRAIDRHVEVTVLINTEKDLAGSNQQRTNIIRSAQKSQRSRLLDMGINLWEWESINELHAKAILIDGHITYVGSDGFSPRAEYRDVDAGLVVDDVQFANGLEETINNYLMTARKATRDNGVSLSLSRRAAVYFIRIFFGKNI